MIDLASYGQGLHIDERGVWLAQGVPSVSYPDEGHDACFGVEERSFWFRHRNNVIVQAVRRWPCTGPLFDVGGGNGCVSRALIDAGIATVLVEPGARGVQNARSRGLPCIVQATTDSARFRPGSLPAVGLFDVIEHIADDRAFMRSIHELLRPDGRLYATVPCYGWLWSGEDVGAGHHRRHTGRSMTALLEGAGFEIDYLTCFFRWLPLPILLARALPWRLGWRNRGGPAAPDASHGTATPRLSAVADRLLRSEVSRVRDGRSMPFGASLLVVARAGGSSQRSALHA
jgi:SAM-dependent methyltransferase